MAESSRNGSPLVTVAIPVYNAGKHLRLAVLSIVRQTFADWELLIIDDGSTDNALQNIADIDDPRIRILCDGSNKGLPARLNEAVDLARGRYFARMDQDDVSYPERFARQIAVLQQDSRLDVVAARAITIDKDNEATGLFPYSLRHEEICAQPWRGFYLPHPTWFGRVEWFRKHRYAVPGPYFCEDQELLLRSYRDSRFATVDEILLGYRVRDKTDWFKLEKTRLTILKIQLPQFLAARQWYFASMTILVYMGRVLGDFVKWAIQLFIPVRAKKPCGPDVERWNVVLGQLSAHT